MFNLKNVFSKKDDVASSSPITSPKNINEKSKETAKNLIKIVSDKSLDTFKDDDSPAKILSGIYKMMVKIQLDDKLMMQLEKNRVEEKQMSAEKRHKEIIKALSSLSFGTRKKPTGIKKQQVEEKRLGARREDLGEKKPVSETKKPTTETPPTPPAKPAAEAPKPTPPTKPAAEAPQPVTKPTAQKPTAEKVPKKKTEKPQAQKVPETPAPATPAPKPTTPAPTTPTQPVTPPTPTPTSPPPAAAPPKVSGTAPVPPVGTGAAATTVGILGAVSAQMAAAEAPHGPEAYIQAHAPIGTKLKDPANLIKKGNIDITTGQKFDKDLTEMTIGEVVELGKRRQLSNPDKATSAMGKYQFLAKTLAERARIVFGENWQNIPFSKDNQDALNKSFIKSNAQKLTALGVPVSTASLYMVHFSGNAQFAKNVMNSPDDTLMSSIMADNQARVNPTIAKLNVKKYKEHLTDKGYTFTTVDNKALQSEPLFNNSAQSINSSSLENQDLNEGLNSPIMTASVINQNNYNMYQPQHRQNSTKSSDDRSAYERKSKTA